MVTVTHQTTRIAETHRHPATTAALVVLFWIAAAATVATAQAKLRPIAPAVGAVAAIAAILLAAFCYTRLCAPHAGISHALGVGIAWLALGIAAELVMAMRVGHEWEAVLGSPDRPLLRNIFFFVWIFAPALFARRDDGE